MLPGPQPPNPETPGPQPPNPETPDPETRGPQPPGPTDHLRRRVLWSLPTGLYVIGSAGEQGGVFRRNLMTANLLVQVSVEPKLVAVAVAVDAVTHALVSTGGCFAVSLLGREDRAVVRRFVKPVPVEAVSVAGDGRVTAMGGEEVRVGPTGSPVLRRAVAWLDCEVRHQVELGSHDLFVGEVVAVGGPAGEVPPLLRMEDTRMSYGG